MAQILQEGKFKEWQREITCATCEAVFLAKAEDLIEEVTKFMWVTGSRATNVSFHLVKCPGCHDKMAIPSSTIPDVAIEKFNDRMKKQQVQHAKMR